MRVWFAKQDAGWSCPCGALTRMGSRRYSWLAFRTCLRLEGSSGSAPATILTWLAPRADAQCLCSLCASVCSTLPFVSLSILLVPWCTFGGHSLGYMTTGGIAEPRGGQIGTFSDARFPRSSYTRALSSAARERLVALTAPTLLEVTVLSR